MGIQDTVMRAAITNMIPAAKRGLAYGIFNAAYDASWFAGSSTEIKYLPGPYRFNYASSFY